jgi:hypothetical protein
MTLLGSVVLRPVAMSVLTRRAGSDADAAGVAAAACDAYDDLAVVVIALIGAVGVEALTARASHLALGEYPSWSQAEKRNAAGPFGQVSSWLERQDSALASEAAAAMLSTLGGLLMTFIGEPLTMRLLRKAWPEGFSDVRSEESFA